MSSWIAYKSLLIYVYRLWSKETPPPGGFPFYYVPWSRTRRKRTPNEEPHPKLINFGGGSSGGVLLIWKPPNKETPPGGGVSSNQLISCVFDMPHVFMRFTRTCAAYKSLLMCVCKSLLICVYRLVSCACPRESLISLFWCTYVSLFWYTNTDLNPKP